MSFIDGRGMQTNRLVVSAVSEPLSISNEELWVKTPSNDRASDDLVITVGICSLGNIEELSASVRESSSN